MADDGERRSRLNISNESWALRKVAQPSAASSDVGPRRPFTGGGPLHPRVLPSMSGLTKRPATASAEKSQSLLFSGSNANTSRLGLRHSGQVQPIGRAYSIGVPVRDGGSVRSLRRSDDILAAPSVATDVPREFPEHPDTHHGGEKLGEEATESSVDRDPDSSCDDDEVGNTIESLREHLIALQSFPDHLQSRFKNLDDLLKEKENDIIELEKRNCELDNDIEAATVKIDEYVKQEKGIREEYNALDEQYISLDRDKTKVVRELDLAKKDREELGAEFNEHVESFSLHVKNCEEATAKKDEILRDQRTDLALKEEKIKEMSEELLYVQRKIENFVDKLRACEQMKAQQDSHLCKAEESRKILDVELSMASKDKAFLQRELDEERKASNSSLVDLKARIQGVIDEVFQHSQQQLQSVRNDLLRHKQNKHALSTQVRCLQTDAGSIESVLTFVIENGAAAQISGNLLQGQLHTRQENLKSAVRNLRNVSLKFDSVTVKGAKCAQAVQRLSSLFANSVSKNIADSSTVTVLRNDNARLKLDHRVMISDVSKSMQNQASIFKSSHLQTLKHFELARSNNVKVVAAAVSQLEDLYHGRVSAIAHTYAKSLSNFSDRFQEFEDELKENQKTFGAVISQDIFVLRGKIEEMKMCLVCEKREHRGCQRRGHELEDALLAKTEELSQLQHSSALEATTRNELKAQNDSLSLDLENVNEELSQSKRKCEEMVHSREKDQVSLLRLKADVNLAQGKSEGTIASLQARLREAWNESHFFAKSLFVDLQKARQDCELSSKALEVQIQKVVDGSRHKIDLAYGDACRHKENVNADLQAVYEEVVKLKHRSEGVQRLLLAKQGECVLLLGRAEGAERALLSSEEASKALKASAKSSDMRAELAEAALSRLQEHVHTLEMKAEKSERRAAEAEAAQFCLQETAAKFELRTKNSEMLARSNGEEVSKNLQLENESLADELRRAKSLAVETEGNLRESAQMTLDALSEKELVETSLATCQGLLSSEKKEVARLTSELETVKENAEVSRNAMMSDIDAAQAAAAERQSEILRISSDRKSLSPDVEGEKEKLSLELSVSRDALEREMKEHTKLVLEHDILAKKAAASEAALLEGRKDMSRMRSERKSQIRKVEAEKEQLCRAMTLSRAALSKEEMATKNLSTEISAQAKRAAAEKETLLNEIRSIKAALFEEKCKAALKSSEVKEIAAEARKPQRGKILSERNCEEDMKSNLDARPAVEASRRPTETLLSAPPHEKSLKSEAVCDDRRESEPTSQMLKHRRGPEKSDGALSPWEEGILHEEGSRAPEALTTLRKSKRKKKLVQPRAPQQFLAAPSGFESDPAETTDGPKRDLKLKLQQKKANRVGFKRPRAIAEEKKSASSMRPERTVKDRPKRTKKVQTPRASATRLGSDDDDDWMVG